MLSLKLQKMQFTLVSYNYRHPGLVAKSKYVKVIQNLHYIITSLLVAEGSPLC